MPGSGSQPTSALDRRPCIGVLGVWRREVLEWYTRRQKVADGLGAAASRGLSEHHLAFIARENESIAPQGLHEPLSSSDPSFSFRGFVYGFFKFGDDRWHSFPFAHIILDILRSAVDGNRKVVGRAVGYPRAVTVIH